MRRREGVAGAGLVDRQPGECRHAADGRRLAAAAQAGAAGPAHEGEGDTAAGIAGLEVAIGILHIHGQAEAGAGREARRRLRGDDETGPHAA